MSETSHTPGPWGWYGNLYAGSPYLATTHSGRLFVMQFARFGLQGAQPRFRLDGRMVNGADLAKFEVGDRDVTGLKAAKDSYSVYRYDMIGIDHPDAHMIAAAPDTYAGCKSILPKNVALQNPNVPDDTEVEITVTMGQLRAIAAATAKAEGRA